MADHTFSGIFYRYHAVIRCPGLDLAEHRIDAVQRQRLDRVTELFQCGSLRECTFRPEIGNGQLFFQCQAGGHDFPEQAHHFLCR